jgi:NAD(P)-dependent dehydrogenase (short-subunit alcohol dehydrogenase family)
LPASAPDARGSLDFPGTHGSRALGKTALVTGASSVVIGRVIAQELAAALRAWSKGLSREVAKHGITVNCLQPGRISSEQMLRMYPTEEKRRIFTQEVPIARFGEPRELADLAVFLASPRASYITGTVIPVDGGLSRFAF